MSVAINPPKTPVTKGSNGIAAATVPNICKMPGPPAPFVPTPLPNIGRSSLSPQGYSKKVKIQGKPVAIKGATFASQGDIASKGTGGGIVSSNTHGPTKFVGPGALDVKIEGKNVQLLSDPMLNNCGPSGNPPNSATLVGVLQGANLAALWGDEQCPLCKKEHGDAGKIEESDSTKAVCSQLKTHADEARKVNKSTDESIRMLGVVECKHKQHYVAQSAAQRYQLRLRLASTGWHYYQGAKDRKTAYQSCVADDHKKKFGRLWKKLKKQAQTWERTKKGEPRHPPGACAGQQAMLLALDHGCRPIAMTERWARKRRIRMNYRRKVEGQQPPSDKVESGLFGGEQAVPPCGTCQVVLTALMCNQLNRECEEQPSKQGCEKC